MSSPTVLLVSFHFHPTVEVGGRRMTELARHLAARGVRVLVVSTFGDRDVGLGSEILPGVLAIPVKRPERRFIDQMVSLKRALNRRDRNESGTVARAAEAKGEDRSALRRCASVARDIFLRLVYFIDENKRWAWRASKAAAIVGREHQAQVVLSSAPPRTVSLAGALAARKLKVPHIVDLRDPWTDAWVSEPRRYIDYMLQRPLEKWVVTSAAAVVSATKSAADLLRERCRSARDRIHVIRNGYDGERRELTSHTGHRLSILFAGVLYLGRDPFPLLAALENLLHRPDVDASRVRLTFMGRADHYDGLSIADWLSGKRCASVVRLLPHGSAEAVAQETAAATVLLNLAQRQQFSVPAKTYEHLICSREVLLICEDDSETAQVAGGIQGVSQCNPAEPLAIESALLDLYQRHVVEGRMTVPPEDEIRGFSREAANAQFWSLINSVAGLVPLPSRRMEQALGKEPAVIAPDQGDGTI